MMPFSNVFALERSTPATRGQYMALYSSSWSVAHTFAPMLGLLVANAWGFRTLWYVLGGLSVLAFLGYQLLERQSVLAPIQPPQEALEEEWLVEEVVSMDDIR